jgi:hypothetical protein
MTARPCCGACGLRRGDEMTQRPDRGCFPRPDGGDGSVVSTCMQPPRRLVFALPPLGSLLCRRGEHLHAAAQYGASLPPLGSHRCRRGACSQRRPVRRAFSAVLWKSRVL